MQNLSRHTNRGVLHGILDDIGDGVVLTDAQERVLYINDAAISILGCTDIRDEPVLFSDICPLVDLDTDVPIGSPIKRAIQSEHSVGLIRDAGIRRSDGTQIYLSATCSPMRFWSGRMRGCSVILRDVTRIRNLERRVDDERQYLRAIFSAASVGLCILDLKGTVIELNTSAEKILRISQSGALGRKFGDAFHCEGSIPAGCGAGPKCSSCLIGCNVENAILHERYTNKFTVPLKRVGAKQPVWLTLFISESWSDRERNIILSIVDISARKNYEDELERARTEAEAASKAKGQFLANMSHEIRTPINGMTGMIDLTLRTDLNAQQRENLESAKSCSTYLLRIINDILDFSKLESNSMELESRRIDFHKLLNEVTDVYRKIAEDKKLYLRTEFSQDLPQYIWADAVRLRQVFHNLLTNAIKFTSKGGVTIAARSGKRAQQKMLEFFVMDTGIGMAVEDQKKLFRPFSQVDASITRRFGGTGLGLMIVRELLTLMGGSIRVRSVQGSGSTFVFWIPCKEADYADADDSGGTVFLRPHLGMEDTHDTVKEDDKVDEISLSISDKAGTENDDTDIADLLKYCEDKLDG